MLPYIALYFTLYVLRAIGAIKKRRPYLWPAFFFVLFLFTALRYGIGWDYWAYHDIVVHKTHAGILSRGEYATTLLINAAQEFNSAELFFVINALIIFTALYFFIRNYSPSPWMSLAIFLGFPLFYLNSLSVVRNFSAIAVVLLATPYALKRNYIVYFLLIFLAASFHKSAFVAALFPIINIFKVPNWGWLIIFSFSALFGPSIYGELASLTARFFPEYLVYTESVETQEGTKAIFVVISVALFLLFFRSKLIVKEKFYSFFINVYLFGAAVYLTFLPLGTLGHRLSLYGTIFMVVLLPAAIKCIESPSARRLTTLLVHLSFAIFFFWTIMNMSNAYIPYVTIFHQ